MSKKVVVGLSGGVDSGVAAYLLKKQGYEVIGVTLNVIEGINGITGKEQEDARECAQKLGIPHYVVDYREEFKKEVLDYFVDSYNSGKTPNPCLVCNRCVKWKALIEMAQKLGADHVATGHYAKIIKLPNGRYTVSNADDADKDQTYALMRLTQEQLKYTMFPLGTYSKSEIRDMAKEAGLHVAEKKDSQDMCFVPDGKYANFIWRETGKRAVPGNFIDEDGNVLGRHKGIIFYTVGQRKGIKLNLGKKIFVKEIRHETNEIVVSDSNGIFSNELQAKNLNFMGVECIDKPIRAKAKIRYSHKISECIVEQLEDKKLHCVFDKPQRAITPGQGLVVYDFDGNILCAGEII